MDRFTRAFHRIAVYGVYFFHSGRAVDRISAVVMQDQLSVSTATSGGTFLASVGLNGLRGIKVVMEPLHYEAR